MANMSSATLQSQFGNISSDRSVASERDFSVSPQEEELNYSTPPLLLPSDLLASSPATNEAIAAQAYAEVCKLLAKSPYQAKKRNQKAKKHDVPEQASLKIPHKSKGGSSALSPPSTSAASESSNVPQILSNMFSAAQKTGGVIKAKDVEIDHIDQLKPVFYAELEESMADPKETAATSETTFDKYALSGTNSVDSDPKLYETVYDNEQR
jgi:hypothetical protein